jgi:hypothetical protein
VLRFGSAIAFSLPQRDQRHDMDCGHEFGLRLLGNSQAADERSIAASLLKFMRLDFAIGEDCTLAGKRPHPFHSIVWLIEIISRTSWTLSLEQGELLMLKTLWNDEAGVILSAELVLIGTILVLGMIVGLVELQCAVVAELSDLSCAFGSLNQSYVSSGFVSYKKDGTPKAITFGGAYSDMMDECDCNGVQLICNPTPEAPMR